MGKRALLVGCNYPGTQAALNGCINDVWGTKNMLLTYYGFAEADITVMIDTDKAYTQPTGANVKSKLTELVNVSQNGDLLVFHFSGHGTQVPSDNNDEGDMKDEAICPTDMNLITDDDLRVILGPLAQKTGVHFTFIADCCHSGTMLDHQAVVITGPKPGGPAPPAIDVQSIQDMLASLGGKRDLKNRSLPFQSLCDQLSAMLGSPVTQGNVRSSMGTIFGADSSVKVQQFVQYAKYAQQALNMIQGGGSGVKAAPTGCLGAISTLLGACVTGGTMLAGQAQAGASGTAGAVGGAVGGATGTAGAAGGAAPSTVAPPPAAGAAPAKLPDEVGVLVSGCQDKETSADACPSGDTSKAHGALSNALHLVVKQHNEQHPGQPLTNRNLVIAVRDALAKSGFAQNPCLECSQKYADVAFINGA